MITIPEPTPVMHFRTSDGQSFATKELAQAHEARRQLVALFGDDHQRGKIYTPAYDTDRCEDNHIDAAVMADWIIQHADQLLDVIAFIKATKS